MNRIEAFNKIKLANNGYTKVIPNTSFARHVDKLVSMGKVAWVTDGYVTSDLDKIDIVYNVLKTPWK
jgi:hypothetical protein